MARKKQTKGNCVFCGKTMSKGGLSRHLSTCVQRQEAISNAEKLPGKQETIIHLQVQDKWTSDFWLHMEMKGSATLDDLDRYLRGIWLECCGHLSMFSIGGWGGEELAMQRRAMRVFKPGVEMEHIYDFGSSSHTIVKVVGLREGKPLSKYPVFLMARNKMPEAECMLCDEQASCFCMECMIEGDETGLLCDTHVEDHPHDDYGEPSPLVNSPRVGVCGYDGSAEPPY